MTANRATTHSLLHRGWDALLDLLFPPHCVSCRRAGTWLCDACIADAPAVPNPASLAPDGFLDGAYSVGAHRGPLRRAVHALKYKGLRQIAPQLAELMASTWRSSGIAVDAIVAVPLSAARLKSRGYCQAHLLARPLAERLGLPLLLGLERTRDTRSQVGLNPAQRWDNVWQAFGWRGDHLPATRVLLIDDVLTTGATLQACAAALRDAGASRVWGLTLTRAWSNDRGKLTYGDPIL